MLWSIHSRRMRKAIAAGTLVLALAGFTAHAAIASIEQIEAAALPPAPGLEDDAGEHFPGAALLTALDDDAAPAAGTTGTIALPDRPVPANATTTAGATIPAAPPFRLRGSGADQSRALQCLTTAIYYEAASEPDAGQRAVAQVVLNRVRHPVFPSTVCGVVFQGSDKRVCQFSFACDGAMARVPARVAWDRAQRVAASALNGSVFAPVGMATHYHTYAVTPSWNRSLVMTGVEGAHFFHRWKGYWGTPAAFRDRYFGGEPTPGPLRKLAAAAPVMAQVAPVVAPVAIKAAAAATATQIQPTYAESGTVVAAADSQILDRWKDSGQPIR
ncbi:cell wall hydrolase [Sphingomonas qomolangmaensis]|uniref:Cell wall hydrolase n=1 Tax=Sphingomonas qomolangmaensis TaxID=2918765 RepID=A0ABY5L300_9SPHN|nr:cell wall hydrolase [Sphingomonas qomolangmaensis]UUL81320.1 cell wall hydrolase [Sphingomonas qomolangmaensis]